MTRCAFRCAGSGKIHVAAQLAVGIAVNAYINHHRAGLDHVARNHARLAGGDDQHIGAAGLRRQIAGFGVAQRHRRTRLQEQHRHGFADDVARADDDGFRAAQRHVLGFEHFLKRPALLT